MADKPKKDTFRPNPFKALKGFCASAPDKAPPKPAVKRQPPPEQDDATLFAQEMQRLGLDARQEDAEAHPQDDARETQDGGRKSAAPSSDRELFLAALGTMETTFSDEVPAEEEARAEPRRMRQVRRGKLAPEARLDLHGLSRIEARQKVRYFLENAVHHGLKTVLVVTGRGKSSGSEPVVRAEVELFLNTEGKPLVSEWGRAPRQYGGEGALIVFLKGEK